MALKKQKDEQVIANCHCGKVSIEVADLPATFTECNCSICRRYGARWAYYKQQQVNLSAAPATLKAYSWGDRTIEFYHCSNCGCLTHYESLEKGADSRIAINTRMLPAELTTHIPCRKFDGADSWSYID